MKSAFALALFAASASAIQRQAGLPLADNKAGDDSEVSLLETRTAATSASTTVESIAEREADKNAARGQVQSDRRRTNEPDRKFVAAAQVSGGMDLQYVTNDQSYQFGRGINMSKIQWKAPTAAAGATQDSDKYIIPGAGCGETQVSLGGSSTDTVWGFKPHPSLANTFYIYAREKTTCTSVWLTASSTCATTTVTLANKPSDEGLWELDPYPQDKWDNNAYTFAGKYSIRSFYRENSDCNETLLATTGTAVALYDERAATTSKTLATADNSRFMIPTLNFLLFQ